MNFLLNLTNFSSSFVLFLTFLLWTHIEDPEYQWPDDYLTSEPYCKLSKCEQSACTLSATNKTLEFDYVIVGSGAGGSIIAYRLSNHFPDRKVLLIEAGAEPSIESISPKTFPFNLNTSATYNYFAEMSPAFSKAYRNGCGCMCGKSIGGSTSVNSMIYVCGTDRDYDTWAELVDDESWNYKHMLQFIKRNQNVQDPRLTTGRCGTFHGTNGPLVVTTSDYDLTEDPLMPLYKASATEKGYQDLLEINCGPPYTGFVQVQSTVKSGERNSAARAFLVPIRNRRNFFYMQHSVVDKILLRKESGSLIVDGISVATKQQSCPQINIKAKRELVISAGTYNSPQILLRSGIGRERDLRACEIPQIKDLPVGDNLADHFFSYHYFTVPSNVTETVAKAEAYFDAEGQRFFTQKSGYFSTSGFNFHWFLNTNDNSSDYPDIQVIFGVYDQNLPSFEMLLKDKFNFKDEFAEQLMKANRENSIIQVVSTLLQPKSRGSVKLRECNDLYAAPRIDANYLSDEEDVQTLLRSIDIINDFFNSKTMWRAGVRPFRPRIPECDCIKGDCEAYKRCYIKYFSQNIWHPTGTCRMGFSTNDSVVDSKLRVFGVRRTSSSPMLRVADASIMPTMTSGNTQCPTYAIGEKAAEMIIEDDF